MAISKQPLATGVGDRDRLLAAALALALWVLYALGACRTIYVGDSGELVAAAATLGIPHPSGYPLYVLLGKLWIETLRVGSVALRMSLFSALWAAGAAAGLFLLSRRLGLSPLASTLSALLLALSPSFWSQANVQRVYSLNAFWLVAAIYTMVVWYQCRRPRVLVVAALVVGIGTSNHTSMGVFGVAAALFVLVTEPRVLRRPRLGLACAGAAVVGLLPYLYLPLRSRADPVIDWGDPETLERWVAVVLRRSFWERAWLESPLDLIPIVADYLHSTASELLWGGAALGVVGAVVARRRGWPVLLLLLVMVANLLSVAFHGSYGDLFLWHRYYIPSYAVAALFAGLGWQHLLDLRPRWDALRWPVRLVLSVAVLIPAGLAWHGLGRFDRNTYRIADDFSRTLLASLPPGAHLSAGDDNVLFTLVYLHLVEGVRPDVNLILQGVESGRLPDLHFDPDVDPLFFTHHPNWQDPQLALVPNGLTYRTVRRGRPRPRAIVVKTELNGESDPKVPKDHLTQNLIGHFHYMLGVTFEEVDWPRAQAELVRAARAAPDNDVLFYNLGLIYTRNGLVRRALRAFERSAAINPRHLASRQQVRASDRVLELREEVARLENLESELAALRGSSPGQTALGDFLEARGEPVLAHGQRLLVLESSEAP